MPRHLFEDQIWPIHFEKGLQDPDTFEKKNIFCIENTEI